MSSQGFSKIELIVVGLIFVAIIIVDIFVIIHLNNKLKDIRTLSEISQISSGLEVFLVLNNNYPKTDQVLILNNVYNSTEKLCQSGFKRLTDSCDKVILDKMPNYYSDQNYTYQSKENATDYQIEFYLKTDFAGQGLTKGLNCATSQQIISQPCN